MEIERINENTIKFYISYLDIEDRGFEREEIWYSRERSEQLFWQMMEEVNYQEDFTAEGPLWIQVQALEKGLEVIVTKAQVSKNGESFSLPDDNNNDGNTMNIPFEGRIENMVESKFSGQEKKSTQSVINKGNLSLTVAFEEFEDVIQLSYALQNIGENESIHEALYHYHDQYFMVLEFSDEESDEEEVENIISQVLEFGHDTDMSIYMLEEYGKIIFKNQAISNIISYFPKNV